MLTKPEESELEFILEDLQREFLLAVREDDYDFIETAARTTQRELQRLMKEIVSRRCRGQ